MYSPVELDLTTVPATSTLAVDTSSLLLATTTSSTDSSDTTDSHVSVIKRPVESEEELSSREVSPAYKVLKLSDSVPTAGTSQPKPGRTSV